MVSEVTKTSDLAGRTEEELVTFIREKQDEILKLKFQKATGQLENIRRISVVKREIARAMTVLRQKKLAN